ncbi:uncharacterized protein METZ01_LOCUS19913 [marine metagenome]|uniref:GatB/YqeY domain-containing protein n=1 Tax=marine metagenome TaxID=408172 RepID=A0A381PLY2_9ZZZZ|tara:strand:+ start:575 stop:1018 length:444 start_codon:yes stop_codon:yes gene_type:complete
MDLKGQIKEEMKTAMKSGDRDRLKVIRLILAAINQIEIDSRTILEDNDIIKTINKMVKQRRDSIAQFSKGGRDDLVEIETNEIAILENYLPKKLSDSELDTIIAEAVSNLKADNMKDMGKVMNTVKHAIEGRADMSLVSSKVKARLS